jgi:signal transduction histidine kinase
MVSAQSAPGHREVPYSRVLLPPALLMAAATAVAVGTVTRQARFAVGICGALCTLLVLAAAAEAVRRGRVVRKLRSQYIERLAFLENRISVHDEETRLLSSRLIPDAVFRLKQGESPDEVVRVVGDEDPAYRELPAAQRGLLYSVLQTVDDEEVMRESTQRAFVNIARRVQAIVHQQSAELRGMEEDHGRNPEVFDDLLRIDHGTALIGRLADSIAVLGGARPGRQWPKPVPLFSVLRGAMSRILEYQRVELHSVVKVAVKGTAVEPLIHACAELIDNATRYSPPQTKVHVTAVEVQAGVAIEIEDGGVSLSEEARARAERILAQAQSGIDLKDLGETPRLGMAVVGRLCLMYDMQVSLRQSAYGGVRAVLIAPHDMLTTGPAPGLAHGIGASAVPRLGDDGELITPQPSRKRRPTGPVPSPPAPPAWGAGTAAESTADDAPVVTDRTPMGLPQRRSRVKTSLRQWITEAHAAGQNGASAAEPGAVPVAGRAVPPAAPQAPSRPEHQPRRIPEQRTGSDPEPGLWVAAFMSGVSGGDGGAGEDGSGPGGHGAGPPDDHEPPGTAWPPARTDSVDVVDEGDLK